MFWKVSSSNTKGDEADVHTGKECRRDTGQESNACDCDEVEISHSSWIIW